MRLALEDHPIADDLQAVRRQGRAGRGDVHHKLGRSGSRGPLGRAAGLHDPVVGNAVFGKEGAGLAHIFGGHAQASSSAGKIGCCDLIKVGHHVDIDPALRRGHDQIGPSKTKSPKQHDPVIEILAAFAQQILTGQAKVNLAIIYRLSDV